MVAIVNNNVIANLTTVMQEMALVCVQKVGPGHVAIRVSSVNINKYINIYIYIYIYILCEITCIMYKA